MSNPIPNNKPFPKGKSGNPNGRPKGSLNRSTIYKRFLDITDDFTNPLTGEVEQITVAEKMALMQILKGLEGDLNATKEVFDSGYGKIADRIIDETGDMNIRLEWTNEKKD
jgi:hypothetical protein